MYKILFDLLKEAITSPRWFFNVRFPYLLRCLFQDPRKPRWKRVEWNTKVYDGMSRNQFVIGDKFITVCNKLKLEQDCYWYGCQCHSCLCQVKNCTHPDCI